jgi:hypothetical protein
MGEKKILGLTCLWYPVVGRARLGVGADEIGPIGCLHEALGCICRVGMKTTTVSTGNARWSEKGGARCTCGARVGDTVFLWAARRINPMTAKVSHQGTHYRGGSIALP